MVAPLHRFWTAAVDEAKERRILIDDAFVCVREERDSFVAMCVYIERKTRTSDFVLTKMEKKFSTFYA